MPLRSLRLCGELDLASESDQVIFEQSLKEFIIDQALICDLRRLMRKKPRIDHLCEAINAMIKTTISAIRTANVILTQLFG